jgi:hypothetical protein
MSTLGSKRIEKKALHEELLVTIRTALDGYADPEEGIQQHVGIHDHARGIARTQELIHGINVNWQGPETNEQAISGRANAE